MVFGGVVFPLALSLIPESLPITLGTNVLSAATKLSEEVPIVVSPQSNYSLQYLGP